RPWPVLVRGEPVGQVTSAAWSPDLATNVAIGMIDRDHWDPGNAVEVESPQGRRAAEVRTLPFTQGERG
ncbi:MAG: glycine cleavage T C-terminal barrel domain-containing protein, partial [Paracoccaceae bacterium]